MFEPLSTYLKTHYLAEDYPVILHQYDDFLRRKPFDGLRILDATPLFFNTIAKVLPLLAAGAELTLSRVKGVPFDPRFVEWIAAQGVRIIDDLEQLRSLEATDPFDLISDCIGLHSSLHPRYGFAELTHSGIGYYTHNTKPCYNTDAGRIKQIEGALGTGDGLLRGLKTLGVDVKQGQRWLLFGFGKIGSGVGKRLRLNGAEVTVVEAQENKMRLKGTPLGDFPFIDMRDRAAVCRAALQATHIVTATSVAGVIGRCYSTEAFRQGQILMNIGAEDEYGERFTPAEVLNGKIAVNFLLDEPTHLRYIETTFALQNAGLEWILTHPHAQGIITPDPKTEEQLLEIVRREGRIHDELRLIGL